MLFRSPADPSMWRGGTTGGSGRQRAKAAEASGWPPDLALDRRAPMALLARSMARTKTLTWAFMVRAGSERDLIEELGETHVPDDLAEGLVVAASRPKGSD